VEQEYRINGTISVTNASVVSMRAEIEAALFSAVRVSLGRIDDASLQKVR
jgi:hypothetical protein